MMRMLRWTFHWVRYNMVHAVSQKMNPLPRSFISWDITSCGPSTVYSPPSTGSEKQSSACHLFSCLVSSTTKVEEICSSETSVGFQRTTWRYVPGDNHRCEDLKSYMNPFPSWQQRVQFRNVLNIKYSVQCIFQTTQYFHHNIRKKKSEKWNVNHKTDSFVFTTLHTLTFWQILNWRKKFSHKLYMLHRTTSCRWRH
jgi:hypothetical protein